MMRAATSRRFSGSCNDVTVECLPYSEFIDRYDRPTTLFYLDPPYLGFEKEYEGGFTRDDFDHLAAQLARIEGNFILSLNDHPFVRECFGKRGFSLARVPITYTAGNPRGPAKRAHELIITGKNR